MEAYALKGGLDLRTGKAQVSPGTLQACLNYEVANRDGYSRIAGIERFDGQFRVAEYTALKLRGTITGSFTAGDAITIGSVTAYVTQVATNALYVLQHNRDTVPTTFPVTATGPNGSIAATACDLLPQPVGKQSVVNTARKALSDAVRPLVGLVPGSPVMPVSGAFWFKNRLYAIRDYPKLWFESPKSWPFRVGDSVTVPGGTFTVTEIAYSSDAYLAGNMTLWPLRDDGTTMTTLPQAGDLITHHIGNGISFDLGGAALGEVPLGMMTETAYGDSSATVTESQQPTPVVGDEPVLRQARDAAALWKATSTGWQWVDLKHEAQFNAGTAAFGTVVSTNLGPGAAPITGSVTFCTAATFNGTDCTAAVDADDGTEVALSGNASDELLTTNFDFSSIPDTATILGIEVQIKRHATAAAECKDEIVELVGLDGTSVNKARSIAWETTSTEVTYGGATDTWGNDNVTPAVLKSANFGVRLVTEAIDATPAGGIDSVKVTVTYRRRDFAVYMWTGSEDIPVNLVDVQLINGAWDGTGAGWIVVDIPNASWSPTIGNGMEIRTAPAGGGDLLGLLASADTPIQFPGWMDIQANQSRYQFLGTNFYGMEDYRAVYGVSGASPAFTYDGTRLLWIRTTLDPSEDLPRHIARHGSSLVLGYYPGAYIVGVVGQPTNFRGEDGAASFEIGDRLTGIMNAVGDALLVTSPSKTMVLHGLDPTTYDQEPVSSNRGAIEYTAADVGLLLVADQLGIAEAQATQAFGDLTRTYVSQQIEEWFKERMQSAAGAASSNYRFLTAASIRSKNQYRMFFQDGTVLTGTANEPLEYTFQRYYLPGDGNTPDQPFTLSAFGSGIDIEGRERIFGSFDADANRGYVFELDHGASFDGQPIPAYFTLNPLSFNTNAQGGLEAMVLKRFDRMFLLGTAEGYAKLGLSRAIDYEVPDGSKGYAFTFGPPSAAFGVRGARGEADAPIEGYEVTVRIDSNTDVEGPHTLQAISTTADARGASRGHVRG